MASLLNSTKGSQVLFDIKQAKTFWPRLKGLLGRSSLSEAEGLWIHQCNSIHTFWMQFPIDCIFLDSELKVKKVCENVRPGRMVLPVWGAKSVIEVKAGLCEMKKVEVGDQLHVGD